VVTVVEDRASGNMGSGRHGGIVAGRWYSLYVVCRLFSTQRPCRSRWGCCDLPLSLINLIIQNRNPTNGASLSAPGVAELGVWDYSGVEVAASAGRAVPLGICARAARRT